MSRYYVVVFGPHTTGAFGSDSYSIESPAAVTSGDKGELIIVNSAREARPDEPGRRGWPYRGPQTIIYPRGAWTKIKIGENVGGRIHFVVDMDSRLEKPERVWDESWNDLLHAISTSRVTGSQGTTSETFIEGRGRQVFKATRRRTIHDGTTLKNAVYDVEEVLS